MWGRGYGGGEERDYIPIATPYTVITRMTPALRWAAMRAILMLLFFDCEGQSHKTMAIDHSF